MCNGQRYYTFLCRSVEVCGVEMVQTLNRNVSQGEREYHVGTYISMIMMLTMVNGDMNCFILLSIVNIRKLQSLDNARI